MSYDSREEARGAEAIASMIERADWDCPMEVSHQGELEPCNRAATTVITYRFDGEWDLTPVCTFHAHRAGIGNVVPLADILSVGRKDVSTSTLNELATASHADATRRGVYPQPLRASLDDIEAEVDEAREAGSVLGSNIWHPGPCNVCDDRKRDLHLELADVLLCTLSTMHDLGMDIDDVVAHKMEFNTTRGARACASSPGMPGSVPSAANTTGWASPS